MVKRRTPPSDEEGGAPLPVPTTSRVLRPRPQARSSASSVSRSSSLRSGASTPVLDKGKGKAREVSEKPSTRASSVASGSGRKTKRIKLDPELEGYSEVEVKVKDKGKGKMRAEDLEAAFGSEDEVDKLALTGSDFEYPVFGGHSVYPLAGSSSSAAIDLCSPETSPIVSSPSLAKLLHPTNSPVSKASSSQSNGKSTASASSSPVQNSKPPGSQPTSPKLDESSLLSAYTCPVCFSPPTNATLTPCGHVLCGSCLFAAVKAGLQRNATLTLGAGQPLCPVCRATIPGWDGKGGGVIGLKVRAIISV